MALKEVAGGIAHFSKHNPVPNPESFSSSILLFVVSWILELAMTVKKDAHGTRPAIMKHDNDRVPNLSGTTT